MGESDTKEREFTWLQDLGHVTFLFMSGHWRGTSDLPYRLVSSLLPGRSLKLTANKHVGDANDYHMKVRMGRMS